MHFLLNLTGLFIGVVLLLFSATLIISHSSETRVIFLKLILGIILGIAGLLIIQANREVVRALRVMLKKKKA